MNLHVLGKPYIVVPVLAVLALGITGFLALTDNDNADKHIDGKNIETIVNSIKERTTIEQKAVKADAVVIGTVKDISEVFELADPDVPEFPNETWPFRDVTVIVDRIVVGKDSIERYGDKEIVVRLLAVPGSEKWFTVGEKYLLILRNPCIDCLYGSDAFIVLGDDDGKFLLKNGKASNLKEGEIPESELIARILNARG